MKIVFKIAILNNFEKWTHLVVARSPSTFSIINKIQVIEIPSASVNVLHIYFYYYMKKIVL